MKILHEKAENYKHFKIISVLNFLFPAYEPFSETLARFRSSVVPSHWWNLTKLNFMHFHVGICFMLYFWKILCLKMWDTQRILCSTFYLSLQTQATMINDYLEQKHRRSSKNVYRENKIKPRCNYSQCKEQINWSNISSFGVFCSPFYNLLPGELPSEK